jgi:hypothetical protein
MLECKPKLLSLYVLCCPVQVEALRRADHPSNGSCKMFKQIHNFSSNSELKQVTRSNP